MTESDKTPKPDTGKPEGMIMYCGEDQLNSYTSPPELRLVSKPPYPAPVKLHVFTPQMLDERDRVIEEGMMGAVRLANEHKDAKHAAGLRAVAEKAWKARGRSMLIHYQIDPDIYNEPKFDDYWQKEQKK